MDTTTLVFLMGAVIWVAVIGWAIHRWKRGQEAREHERSMRYQQLIGPALVGGAGGGSGPAVAPAPTAAQAVAGAAPGGAHGIAAGTGAGAVPQVDPARLAEALMSAQRASVPRTPASASGLSSPARTSSALMPDAAILRAPPFRLRDRLLDKPATLALYAIRAAMPEHEVFVRVSLAELVDVPESVHGYDRAQRLKKLAPLTVDYAVANKAMQLIAVIDLEDPHPTAEQRESHRAKAEYLRALPVRHLTFSRARLPRYQDIRQLVLSAA